MKRSLFLSFFSCLAVLFVTQSALPQDTARFEVSGLVGGAKIADHAFPPVALFQGLQEITKTTSDATFAWQANFGWRALNAGPVAVFLEVPVTSAVSQKIQEHLTIPSSGGITLTNPARSAYFITPGVRFRFFNGAFAPYAVTGFGLESGTLFSDHISARGRYRWLRHSGRQQAQLQRRL